MCHARLYLYRFIIFYLLKGMPSYFLCLLFFILRIYSKFWFLSLESVLRHILRSLKSEKNELEKIKKTLKKFDWQSLIEHNSDCHKKCKKIIPVLKNKQFNLNSNGREEWELSQVGEFASEGPCLVRTAFVQYLQLTERSYRNSINYLE